MTASLLFLIQVHFDDEVSEDSSISTIQGTLTPSASYESGHPPSLHSPAQPNAADPSSAAFPSGLSRSFSSRLFKFKKKSVPSEKSTPIVPVMYLDMPD